MNSGKILKLTAVIIRGPKDRWTRTCNLAEAYRPIWKIATETQAQLESDQYLTGRGFRKDG